MTITDMHLDFNASRNKGQRFCSFNTESANFIHVDQKHYKLTY